MADGASTDLGELALGQNMLIAFMPWNGYNFEDSILISERVVADDRYTSIHIEELTSWPATPSSGRKKSRATSNLAEASWPSGRVGHRVHRCRSRSRRRAGRQGHAEGRNPADAGREAAARDLRREGFRREGHLAARAVGHERHRHRRAGVHPRRHRARQARPAIIDDELKRYRLDLNDQLRIVEGDAFQRLERCSGKVANGGPKKLAKGTKIDKEYLDDLDQYHWFDIRLADDEARSSSKRSRTRSREASQFDLAFEEKRKKLTQGDELPPGVQKMVKVYLAVKRRLQPGDKMAGRHGNKGVVEDRADRRHAVHGRRPPADIVLNPLGVPSRMNIGQVRSAPGLGRQGPGRRSATCCSAGQVAELRKFLTRSTTSRAEEDLDSFTDEEIIELANLREGVPFATPVFDGATEESGKMLDLAYPDDIAGTWA
jgi:DNA-directed RNA polymerase subunit beta